MVVLDSLLRQDSMWIQDLCGGKSIRKKPLHFPAWSQDITIVAYKSRRFELWNWRGWTVQPHGVTEPKGISSCHPSSPLQWRARTGSCHLSLEEPVVVLKLPSLALFQAANAFEGEHPLPVVPMLVTGLSWWLTAVIMRLLWGGNQCTELFLCLMVRDLGGFVPWEALSLAGWARVKDRTRNDCTRKIPVAFSSALGVSLSKSL